MKTIIEKARELALECHKNQMYGEHPYYFHLNMVFNIATKWIHLIPEEDREDVLAGCLLHDSLEDTEISYNNLLNATNKTVAEYAYALQTEKGRTRKDRANAKYYDEIREYKYARFIKLCDRIANSLFSKENGSDMFKKYKEELMFMHEHLWISADPFEEMWKQLYSILEVQY